MTADYLCIKNKIYWIHDNSNVNNPNNPLSKHNNKHK